MNSVMLEPFPGEPVTGTSAMDQINRRLFKDAGANARQNIILRLPFKNDVVDPGEVEKPAQKQTGRPGTNDNNLLAHLNRPSRYFPQHS